MNMQSLVLIRHLVRRAHQERAKVGAEDVDLYATAHEELCELIGRLDLLSVLCQIQQRDQPGGAIPAGLAILIGAAVGSPHPAVLKFKAEVEV